MLKLINLRSRSSALVFATLFILPPFAVGQPVLKGSIPAPQSTEKHVMVGQASDSTPEEIGDAMVYHKRYQAALDEYKRASPTSEVLNKMGMAYHMMFDLPEAVRSYQNALKIDPTNSRALNNLGTAYDSLQDPGKAESMYRKAIKLDPKNALFRKNLGSSLIAQQKYKQGWESYQDALRLDPKIFERCVPAQVEKNLARQDRGAMNYYMAKGCARAGMHDCALKYLQKSVNEGFVNLKGIQTDREFTEFLELPEFRELFEQELN